MRGRGGLWVGRGFGCSGLGTPRKRDLLTLVEMIDWQEL